MLIGCNMKKDDNPAIQLAAIQAELVTLFGDFCRDAATPEIATLMQQFTQHRLSLVFTVTASMHETGLFCGFVAAGAAPHELQALFTVHAPSPGTTAGALH